MATTRACLQCGTVLPGHTAAWLCPRCLLRQAAAPVAAESPLPPHCPCSAGFPDLGCGPPKQMAAARRQDSVARFQDTHWSLVLAAGHGTPPASQAALEAICRNYWAPLYAFVRRRGYSPHDAEDLTQDL